MMIKQILQGLYVVSVILIGCVINPDISLAADYQVSKGDRLDVSVFQWPEYSGETIVDESGMIAVPALGRLKVQGMTLAEIEEQVTERLEAGPDGGNFHVVISVAEYRPVSVLGMVVSPGRYPFTSGMTVLDAVSAAGGYMTFNRGRNRNVELFGNLFEAKADLEIEKLKLWGAIARRARLEAEASGLESIDFPPDLMEEAEKNSLYFLMKHETRVFHARKKMMAQELSAIDEINGFLDDEIALLERQERDVRVSLSNLRKELKNQNALLKEGLATRITVIVAERQVVDLQSEQRQSIVSLMKARRTRAQNNEKRKDISAKRRVDINNELIETTLDIAVLRKKIVRLEEYLSGFDPGGERGLMFDQNISPSSPHFEVLIYREDVEGERQPIRDVSEVAQIIPGDILDVQLRTSSN